MKTTVEISEALLRQAKKIKAERGRDPASVTRASPMYIGARRQLPGVRRLWPADGDFTRFSGLWAVNPLL